MTQILENVNLKHLNTFGIEAYSKYYTEINSINDFQELLQNKTFVNSDKLIVGGGSNMLFTKNFEGIVLKNNLKGIKVVKEDAEFVEVQSAAGEVWHDFVMWCIDKNYGGLENLSLIPGCVGASPMQNIGAYGVEIKDVFSELEAIEIETGKKQIFNKAQCKFGYRESVFKHELKNKFIITAVTFRLAKKPIVNTSYGAISSELETMGVKTPGIKDVSQAVINIRSSKLPDPKVIGNAGSFFKNPEVEKSVFQSLKIRFPSLVAYEMENGKYKLAAGWLIEKSDLKGFVSGNAAVHDKQALVLVNKGKASGSEIFALSEHVLQTVFSKFGIKLEREVNII
ncbi:MAG: UDP-N-acetylmuramate dehydrogenase [Bacteroidia bacterium]|nr:UDP-N-acetylmuramate dehydrogenase [Bacteroidia bacterium]